MLFNKIKKKKEQEVKDLTKERNDRCFPIVKKVVEHIAKTPIVVGSNNAEEITENYMPATEKLLQMFLKENVRIVEIDYIMRLTMEHFERIRDFAVHSTGQSLDKAIDKKWGKNVEELTMGDVDKVLKA